MASGEEEPMPELGWLEDSKSDNKLGTLGGSRDDLDSEMENLTRLELSDWVELPGLSLLLKNLLLARGCGSIFLVEESVSNSIRFKLIGGTLAGSFAVSALGREEPEDSSDFFKRLLNIDF